MSQSFTNFFFLIIFQYSLDNEAERQKYEILQAQQHIQPEGTTDSSNFLQHQDSSARTGGSIPNLHQHQHQSSPINEALSIRNNRMASADRRVQAPRSANLEQLYHEAIPMNKALSHSGPSAFGNGLIVSFIELPTLMHNGLKFEKKCCSIFVVSFKEYMMKFFQMEF